MPQRLRLDVAQLRRALPHLPTVRHSRLWHIGTLNPADKGVDGPSQEGSGLSVSWCPESWLQIARLGGRPRWRMSRADKRPGRFLDFHRLSDAERATLTALFLELGLLRSARRYRVSYFDEDTEDTRHFLVTSKRAGAAEARDVRGACQPVTVVAPTALLCALAMQRVHDLEAFELALTVVIDFWPLYDGVWWSDRHDVDQLSAPRGVISRSALANWTSAQP